MTLGFGVLTRLLRSGFDGPLEVRAALGHGRSYGSWSTVAVRSLPGIVDCGLWQSLNESEKLPTFALLTDVGNDLMYGYPPETIASWVETSLDRLAAVDARIIVTRLPLARVERLAAWHYHVTRLSLFPFHRAFSWQEMLRRARELDSLVAQAASGHHAAIVTPPPEWYGLDPIHIRRRHRPAAWADVLSNWPDFQAPVGPLSAAGLPLLGRFPERLRLFGRERTTPQPVVSRSDVTLSLY